MAHPRFGKAVMTTVPVHEDFLPYVDAVFRFAGWHDPLRLREVEVGRNMIPGRAAPPFMLLFEGPRGAVLPEGMYEATAADGRSFLLYIMPIHTPDRSHQDYQAVFN